MCCCAHKQRATISLPTSVQRAHRLEVGGRGEARQGGGHQLLHRAVRGVHGVQDLVQHLACEEGSMEKGSAKGALGASKRSFNVPVSLAGAECLLRDKHAAAHTAGRVALFSRHICRC